MLHILAHHGRYVHRHEDLIAIAGECGGQILSLFEYWTACREAAIQQTKTLNSQIKGGNYKRVPDRWLNETLEDIRIGLLGGWGITSIKKTIKELVDKDYLIQSKHRNPWLRTKCYQLNIPIVQKALDDWKNQQQGLSVDLAVQVETPCTSDKTKVTLRVDENNLIDEPKTLVDYILNNPNEHSLTTSPGSEILEMQNKKELSSNLPAFLPDPEEKNVSGGGAGLPYSNITEWLDAVLAGEDEYIHPAMKSFKKSTGWKYPWRTSQRDEAFGTCDPKLVEFIAKKWQSENNRSEPWRTRIPDVIKHINDNEQTKSGLEKILGYWKLASKSQKSTEVQEKPKRQRPPYEPPPGVIVPERPQLTGQAEKDRLNAKGKEPKVNPETLEDNEWIDKVTERRMKVEGELIYEQIFGTWTCVDKPKEKQQAPIRQIYFGTESTPEKRQYIKACSAMKKELGRSLVRDEEELIAIYIKACSATRCDEEAIEIYIKTCAAKSKELGRSLTRDDGEAIAISITKSQQSENN